MKAIKVKETMFLLFAMLICCSVVSADDHQQNPSYFDDGVTFGFQHYGKLLAYPITPGFTIHDYGNLIPEYAHSAQSFTPVDDSLIHIPENVIRERLGDYITDSLGDTVVIIASEQIIKATITEFAYWASFCQDNLVYVLEPISDMGYKIDNYSTFLVLRNSKYNDQQISFFNEVPPDYPNYETIINSIVEYKYISLYNVLDPRTIRIFSVLDETNIENLYAFANPYVHYFVAAFEIVYTDNKIIDTEFLCYEYFFFPPVMFKFILRSDFDNDGEFEYLIDHYGAASIYKYINNEFTKIISSPERGCP